ncbi:hypothetical protein ZHAS_00018558 [Anopheles sinensis]|uniref:Uncharacterized protein n=1 Tax=Anopheles sinensis TaxID=74873 RepID=A0A084WJX4_ANOSI|nr:hypothetical protein ZHAS_00018558 [Anopheles sinensis]
MCNHNKSRADTLPDRASYNLAPRSHENGGRARFLGGLFDSGTSRPRTRRRFNLQEANIFTQRYQGDHHRAKKVPEMVEMRTSQGTTERAQTPEGLFPSDRAENIRTRHGWFVHVRYALGRRSRGFDFLPSRWKPHPNAHPQMVRIQEDDPVRWRTALIFYHIGHRKARRIPFLPINDNGPGLGCPRRAGGDGTRLELDRDLWASEPVSPVTSARLKLPDQRAPYRRGPRQRLRHGLRRRTSLHEDESIVFHSLPPHPVPFHLPRHIIFSLQTRAA